MVRNTIECRHVSFMSHLTKKINKVDKSNIKKERMNKTWHVCEIYSTPFNNRQRILNIHEITDRIYKVCAFHTAHLTCSL